MSIFGTILHKIFAAAGADAPPDPIAATTVAATPAESMAPGIVPPAVTTAAAPAQPVDVQAVLTQMASQKGGGGNWQSSIVDLLKLLDMDSSLAARKQLAAELDVHAGADGTAEENTALHQAVMQKVADNGGTVPQALRG